MATQKIKPTSFSKSITASGRDGNRLALTLRTLDGQDDYEKFLELEKVIWGQDFSECVPASMLMINQLVGGLSAGAFDADGKMLALIYGLTGPQNGTVKHWSHLMGVHVAYRGYGLGMILKRFQRDFLLASGIDEVQWTYDPLESKNAHLNLNHLGALPIEYKLNVYGDGSSSGLHAGIGTDRFVACWRIGDERVRRILAHPLRDLPERFSQAPTVNTIDGVPGPGEGPLPEIPLIRVEIPNDIQSAKQTPGLGRRWRNCTRHAFLHYFQQGYQVVRYYACHRSYRGFYVMSAPGETQL